MYRQDVVGNSFGLRSSASSLFSVILRLILYLFIFLQPTPKEVITSFQCKQKFLQKTKPAWLILKKVLILCLFRAKYLSFHMLDWISISTRNHIGIKKNYLKIMLNVLSMVFSWIDKFAITSLRLFDYVFVLKNCISN